MKVVVACSQREKLKAQINQKRLSVKIDLKDTSPTDTLLLTRGQIAKIEKARELGRRKYKTIRMSRKQIEKNRSHQGGYLNVLDDFAVASSPTVDNDDGFYLIKQRHCMRIYPVQDDGLYLKTIPSSILKDTFEDGLYIKHGHIIENGERLVFAENSPYALILAKLLL